MRNKYVLIVIGLWLFFNAFAYAQVDFLLIEDGIGGAGSSNNPVNVILANENELGGLQFVMDYDSALFSVDTITALDRLSEMDIYFNETMPGHLIILVTDFAGQTISTGEGAVLQIEMSVSQDALPQAAVLGLNDVVLSNSAGQTVPVSSVDGYFIITGANILRMGNGYAWETTDTVSVDLYNEVSVGAVQFTLNYNSATLSMDTILSTSRSDMMTLNYNDPQAGEVILLLYSLSMDSILSGEGSILKMVFDVMGSSSSTVNPLHFQDVVLTEPSGAGIEVESIDGYFIVKNHAPAIVNPIPDVSIAEDTPPFTIVLLDTIFEDPDGDVLTFTATSSIGEVYPLIVDEDQLRLLLANNWYGEAEIFVRASDGVLGVQDTMQLTVTPVNDPPGVFHLLSPQNESVISDTLMTFQWTHALDPENDDVTYNLRIYTDTDTVNFEDFPNNLLTVDVPSNFEDQTPYFWFVEASDGELNTISQETFWFFTDYLVIISEEHQFPDAYRLLQNYPNPFNPTTTISYQLPKPAFVNLSVYNITGNLVETLVNEYKKAGYFSVTWNVPQSGIASGLYFYRIRAGKYSDIKKCIILK